MSPSPTSRTGEVACFVWLPSPPVVRSFAPPTGGYDSSDPQGVGYTSCFNGDGRPPTRHSRASLQRATRLALTGTDAQIVRPYKGLHVLL